MDVSLKRTRVSDAELMDEMGFWFSLFEGMFLYPSFSMMGSLFVLASASSFGASLKLLQ